MSTLPEELELTIPVFGYQVGSPKPKITYTTNIFVA